MNKPVETICSELVLKGLSEDGLFDLSNACRDRAKTATPILLWLALDAFFRRIGSSLHDGAIASRRVNEIANQLRPMLEALSKPFDGPNVMERHLIALRNLL